MGKILYMYQICVFQKNKLIIMTLKNNIKYNDNIKKSLRVIGFSASSSGMYITYNINIILTTFLVCTLLGYR